MNALRIAALGLAACAAFAQQSGALRAAAVKVDITPATTKWLAGYAARQSTGIHDRLHHRVLALDDGASQFFLLSTEICVFSPSVYDGFVQRLEKETGIGRLQVWWTVTHTHSGPEVGPPGLVEPMMPERYTHEWDVAYTDEIQASLIAAIKEARGKLEPARLAAGTGFSSANINRRARDPEGRISLGYNPDGPVDRQIGLIRLERPDGSPIALVANYAIHGTALGGRNTLISGDAPGTVSTYVEGKLGAPVLFVNGAAGDIAPIYTVQDNFRAAHITEFNVLLGDKILSANRTMAASATPVRIRASERMVHTPRKPDFGWAKDLAAYLDARPGEAGTVRFPVRFLFLNDELALWAAPVEMFCEIAMHVRNRSPFRHTFFFGYTNGWFGYLPTRAGFAEGGYEARTTPFTDRVEQDLVEVVLSQLQGRVN